MLHQRQQRCVQANWLLSKNLIVTILIQYYQMHQQQQQQSSQQSSVQEHFQRLLQQNQMQQHSYQQQIQQLQNMIKMVKLDGNMNSKTGVLNSGHSQNMPRQQQLQQSTNVQVAPPQRNNSSPTKRISAVDKRKFSPEKIVELAAESHEMLAQLMRTSASILAHQQIHLLASNCSQSTISPEREHGPSEKSVQSSGKKLSPYRERNQRTNSENSSPQIMKLYSIQEEEIEKEEKAPSCSVGCVRKRSLQNKSPLTALTVSKQQQQLNADISCFGQQQQYKGSKNDISPLQPRQISPPRHQRPQLSQNQQTYQTVQPQQTLQTPPARKPDLNKIQNSNHEEDPITLAKQQASNLFELGLQMSQTALTFLQTVIKKEKYKKEQHIEEEETKLEHKTQNLGKRNNSAANQIIHPHQQLQFSTLQLSEVKKDGSFIDDPRSPPHVFSGLSSTLMIDKALFSKSHAKRASADWTTSKKGDLLLSGQPFSHSGLDNESSHHSRTSSQKNVKHRKSSAKHNSFSYNETPQQTGQNMIANSLQQNTTVSQKPTFQMSEREKKIIQFTQMNEKLNEMKEKFKKEMMTHEAAPELLMKVDPQRYLDNQLCQMSKSFGERRKQMFKEEMAKKIKDHSSQLNQTLNPESKQGTKLTVSQQKCGISPRLSKSFANPVRSSQSLTCQKNLQGDMPILTIKKREHTRDPSLSQTKTATLMKARPEMSFDTANKINPQRDNTCVPSTLKRIVDRSLSKSSISNAKSQVRAAQSKPCSVAWSPPSQQKLLQTASFNKNSVQRPNLMGGLSDVPMFKTTVATSVKKQHMAMQDHHREASLKKIPMNNQAFVPTRVQAQSFNKEQSVKRIQNHEQISFDRTNNFSAQPRQRTDILRQPAQTSINSRKQSLGASSLVQQPQQRLAKSRLSLGNTQSFLKSGSAAISCQDLFATQKYQAPLKSLVGSQTSTSIGTQQYYQTVSGPSLVPQQTQTTTSNNGRKRSQASMHGDLTSQLAFAGEKLNHYRKLINFTQIIDFKRQGIAQKRNNSRDTESKACIRAARSLCMLLEAFYMSEGQLHYGPTMSFESWSEICGFIHRHSHRIVYDINGGLLDKIDSATTPMKLQEVINPAGYQTLLKIYTDIFLMEASDLHKTSQFLLQSPRVRNLQYKPVFCFVYFMITYFMIKKKMMEVHSGSQHSLLEGVPQEILHSSRNRSGNRSQNKSITTGKDLPTVQEKVVVKRQKTPDQLAGRNSPPSLPLQQSSGSGVVTNINVGTKWPCTNENENQTMAQVLASQVASINKQKKEIALHEEDKVEAISEPSAEKSCQNVDQKVIKQEAKEESSAKKCKEATMLHPYLQQTIRPINTISRILSNHQSTASIKSHGSQGSTVSGGNPNRQSISIQKQNQSTVSHRSQGRASPSKRSNGESSRIKKEQQKKTESKVFEDLEKEVEHQFQQLQLAYGIVNQSSILDSSLASLKHSLQNLNPMVSSASGIKPLSLYKAGGQVVPNTTQISPSGSLQQLRASVTFSGGQGAALANSQINEEDHSQDKSFSFVKQSPVVTAGYNRQTNQLLASSSNANTSFGSRGSTIHPIHHQGKESLASSTIMSIHQQRREIVDKLIDSRKRSAEKRQQSLLQQTSLPHSSHIYDPSLDEGAWQIIKELGNLQRAGSGNNQSSLNSMSFVTSSLGSNAISLANKQQSSQRSSGILSPSGSQRKGSAAANRVQLSMTKRIRD